MPGFNIRPQDIPLLIRALQSLESVPVGWFGPVDDPDLITEMKRTLPALFRQSFSSRPFAFRIWIFSRCSKPAATSVLL